MAPSHNWQGRSMYMFPPFPLLNKVIQKLCAIQEAEVILIAPWWPSQPWFPHLLRLCGSPTILSILPRPAVTTGTEIHFGLKVVPSARMEALMQRYKAAGFWEEVSRLAAAAPRRPSTNRMYDNRWLRFTHWAAGEEFDPLSPKAAQVAFLYSLCTHVYMSV